MLENLTDRLRIALRVDMHEARFEILFEGQIEETIQTVLPVRLSNSSTGLFFSRLT